MTTKEQKQAYALGRKHEKEEQAKRSDTLLAAAKAVLDYAGMTEFLADSDCKLNHVWSIRKAHLLRLRRAIEETERA